MPITVNCTDGKIKIGGDFQNALSKVKAIQGRKYNPGNKEWSVPVSVKHFDMCGHPIDVLQGNGSIRFQDGAHQTAYGNVYDRNEWQADREAEKDADKVDFSDQLEEVNSRYREQLEALNIPPQRINTILNINFADLVECGRIKFQSPERSRQIMAIWEAWINDYGQVCMDEEEARDAAREKVYDYYGIE